MVGYIEIAGNKDTLLFNSSRTVQAEYEMGLVHGNCDEDAEE
jgi:hypothetical protein